MTPYRKLVNLRIPQDEAHALVLAIARWKDPRQRVPPNYRETELFRRWQAELKAVYGTMPSLWISMS